MAPSTRYRPLTPDTWTDFERLFGPSGAYSGCWCMWWRQTRRQFDDHHGEDNRCAMQALVDSGTVPGILAYGPAAEGDPAARSRRAIGWCSVAPREEFASLNRSRVLKPIDDRPVWSIVCLFVAREHRGRGVAEGLIRAAVEHARARGAEVVEAYPTAPRGRRLAAVSSYMGVPAQFERAGFVEVGAPSEARRIMRCSL